MKHRFPSPTTPRHGRNGCLAVIAAGMLALTAFGGTAANATTHRHTVVPNVVTCNSTDFRMQNFIGTPEGFG